YALSKSDGADPTRLADALAAGFNATDAAQNGEPFGELGLVDQHDAAWHSQTGPPSDPQAGNTPGTHRAVLRSPHYRPGAGPASARRPAGSTRPPLPITSSPTRTSRRCSRSTAAPRP